MGTGNPQKTPEKTSDTVIENFWDWVAVILFLMFSIDLLTSLSATGIVGVSYENNPIMRELLQQPPHYIILAHLAILIITVLLFYGLNKVLVSQKNKTENPKAIELATELFVGLLLAIGLFIFANNLTVIFHRQPLF